MHLNKPGADLQGVKAGVIQIPLLLRAVVDEQAVDAGEAIGVAVQYLELVS